MIDCRERMAFHLKSIPICGFSMTNYVLQRKQTWNYVIKLMSLKALQSSMLLRTLATTNDQSSRSTLLILLSEDLHNIFLNNFNTLSNTALN